MEVAVADALLKMLSVADEAPAVAEVNLTGIVHDAPGANVAQVLVSANAPAFVPPSCNAEIVRFSVPPFDTVTSAGRLSDPTCCSANDSDPGVTSIDGADPPPPPQDATVHSTAAA